MPTAELEGVALRYESAGSGEPVILIPGFVTSLRLFDRQVEAVSRDFRCLRYDLRGQGESSAPESGYATADHAQDLRLLIEHLNLPRAHLVGASLGGAVAVHLALEHPELVRSLTLAGAVVDGFPGWHDEYGVRLRNARRLARSEGVEAALADWLTHPFFHATRGLSEFAKTAVRTSGAAWLASGRGSQGQPADFSRIDEIEKPTLVLVGEADVEPCRKIAEALGARVRGARLGVVKEAGHLPCWDRPEEFNRLLLDFLHSVGRPEPARP